MRLILNNKWILYCLILILFSVLIFLVKTTFIPADNLPKKSTTVAPTSTPKPVDLCAKFAADKARISCKQAVKLALAKYPGDVKLIKSETASIFTGTPRSDSSIKKEVWTIGINLKTPMEILDSSNNSVELFIIKEDGKLQEKSFSSGKYL